MDLKAVIREAYKDEPFVYFFVARKADEIGFGVLKQRAQVMLQATHEFKKYDISHKGLSMEDM